MHRRPHGPSFPSHRSRSPQETRPPPTRLAGDDIKPRGSATPKRCDRGRKDPRRLSIPIGRVCATTPDPVWPVHDRGSTAPSGVVARPSASQGPDGRSAPFRQGLGAARTRPKSEWYAHLTLPPRLMATAGGRRAFREDPRAPSRLPTPGRVSRLYYQRYLAEATMVL